jgi:glyoxylate reductase
MALIVITRKIPDCAIELLQTKHTIRLHDSSEPMSREKMLDFVRGADGILSLLGDRVDAQYMDAAGPQLRAIANYAVGFNNIDLSAAKTRNIAIGNTPDVLTDATADIAVGLMLAAGRHFGEATRMVRELGWKTWDPVGLLGVDLVGATLGIVGMGRIGEAVAKRCHFGWNMKVVYTSRSPKPEIDASLSATRVSLDELLSSSDIVSLHVDLNAETNKLINAERLRQMKPSAILINTARGAVIDQDALFDSLKNKRIFAAGLDVTEPEPLPSDSPLRSLSNCYILPHIGSATKATRDAMANRAAQNLLAALDGKPMPYPVALP